MKIPHILPAIMLASSICFLNRCVFGAGKVKQENSAENPMAASMPYAIAIQVSPEGHIFLKAEVDHVEGNFILDTGAGLNVITRSFASKLKGGLEEEGNFTGFRATGEEVGMRIYKLRDIKIGNMSLRNQPAAILDVNIGKADGLISLSCFRNRPFTIDFASRKIYLETRRSLSARTKNGKTVPIQLDDDRGISLDMFTKVRVNDSLTLQIALDSGAGFNVYRMNAEFIKDLGIDTSTVKKYLKESTMNPGITNTFFSADVEKICLAAEPSVGAVNVRVSFLPGLIYDGITGINWLGREITIDLPHKRIIVN